MTGLRSMTGFGRESGADERHEIRIELRSVNHRHLVWKGNWPSYLQSLESEADTRIRQHVLRGSVSMSIAHEALTSEPSVRFDSNLAKAYREQLQELARTIGVDQEPDFGYLLGLPGVVEVRNPEPTADELRVLVLDVLDRALHDFVASREREGERLVADLNGYVDELESLTETIESRWPQVVEDYRARLHQRVVEFLDERGHSVEQVELLREVAIFADKSDIAEELARFKGHLTEMRRILAASGSVGRALDFLTQEMLREANTIGSKVSDLELSHRVVALKTALDRIKEQVQNLE